MRKPRHRNSTRDREKAELATLRNLTRELEAHVSALSRGERSPHQNGVESAWRSLCERQIRSRKAAEQTNRDLNERVQSNADWIYRLWELLCEKRNATQASRLPSFMARHSIQAFDPSGENEGANLLTDRWSNTTNGDLESTLLCVRRIPFDVHSTSAALWTALSRPETSFASGDFPIDAKTVERTPDMCCHKSQYSVQVEGKTVLVNFHAVVRPLEGQAASLRSSPSIDSTANAFVWKSSFTLANSGAKHVDTLWATVVRSPSHPLESIITVVCQTQLGLTPGPYASSLQTQNMQVVGGCIGSIISSVENMLLDGRWHGVFNRSASIEGSPTQSIDL
ncbi:hypothetical protein PHMEG_00035723 [Phytophthora megakarya]|uniref:M96 mating-specific protein n=1 Tax=Phytophthora megakarya TaxID=4795 RepID=A0A225UPM8_9STRA|nr:hypothetical protein PHMEG_00035723 [Phytophthora megakarya]